MEAVKGKKSRNYNFLSFFTKYTKNISYIITVFTLVTGSISAFASSESIYAEAGKQFKRHLPNGTIVSTIFYDLDRKKTLYSYHGDQMMISASLSKIPTALAAHKLLGQNFQFVTKLQTPKKFIKNNELKSDLWVNFGGDPTLTDTQLKLLFSQLQKKGIHSIRGNVYIDSSIFAGYPYGTGWAWDDLSIRFAAPVTASIVNHNAFRVSLLPGKELHQPAVLKFQRPVPPIKMDNNIITAYPTPAQVSGRCELSLVMQPGNYYKLDGCIEPSRRPQQLFFAINDPSEFISYHVKRALQQNNIQLTGRVIADAAAPTANNMETLAEHRSQSLNSILATMLKKSDNLIADTLLKFMGHRYYKTAGTFDNGSQALRNILQDDLNIDLKNSVMVDGSGLSSYNLLSAKTFMQLLIKGWNIPNNKLNFPNSLSIVGRDGTLVHRQALKRKKLSGRVSAKTGTLSGVSNLAGYLITEDNHHVAFVIMLNHFSPPRNHGRRGKRDGSDSYFQAEWLSWVSSKV